MTDPLWLQKALNGVEFDGRLGEMLRQDVQRKVFDAKRKAAREAEK